ncbi:ComEC/Rec2 family competence protein [Verrucomicrobiaceae bacterium N1E253]|uniref:ComEC/Rec2 family competence protein n=1 Tax=Oceaniferula marina TaxID=2748318 RepID=A0A851GGB0_9BACT|nr:ComEC/Rec2 family competence protein [Oceaniferula marina]NWK55942.1 ComEC/Rec2 family competence protein [Oceaniferula marina]
MPSPNSSPKRTPAQFLTKFPLWPLILGTLLGVLIADHCGLHFESSFGLTPPLLDSWFWLIETTALAALALIVRKPAVTLLSLGIIFGHLSHGLTIERQQEGRQYVTATPDRSVTIHAVILDTGRSEKGPYLAKVITSDQSGVKTSSVLPAGLRIVLITSKDQTSPLQIGDLVHVQGSLSPIPPPRNPHGFDLARWRHRQGANLQLVADHPVQAVGINTLRIPLRTMAKWRNTLRKNMTRGLEPESEDAQLIRAVVLGERPPQPSTMIDDFRNSGTLHVFAVSGLHVGMVGLLIGFVLSLLRAPRWMIITLTILGMALYAGITGGRPPAVRAVIMASVFLSGFLVKRHPVLINSLAASAVLVLLWDGHQLFTPGFQLSYGVLLAIALFTRFWTQRLHRIGQLDPFMPRLLLSHWQERRLVIREHLQGSLSVSCAAWMGSSPLIWIHFGIITPISILASIPLMLMIFGVLALAMASISLGSLSSKGGEKINQLNALLARVTRNTAAGFATVPGSHFHKTRKRPEHGQVIIFDLPKGGGAQFLDFGGGILYDSGSPRNFRFHVQPTLTHLRARPDSLIISHADSSHCGAMYQCLSLYQPKQAIIPRPDQRSPSYRQFIRSVDQYGCRTITPQPGQCFLLSSEPSKPLGTFLEILHAPANLKGRGRADDTGLVTRLHWRGWTILFTSDAGWITENRLLQSGLNLQADVLVMGRNANDYTGQLHFIDAVSPQAIISSHAPFPEAERIPNTWAASIRQRGIHLIDQQQSGAVTLTMEKDQLKLSPTLPDRPTLILTR